VPVLLPTQPSGAHGAVCRYVVRRQHHGAQLDTRKARADAGGRHVPATVDRCGGNDIRRQTAGTGRLSPDREQTRTYGYAACRPSVRLKSDTSECAGRSSPN